MYNMYKYIYRQAKKFIRIKKMENHQGHYNGKVSKFIRKAKSTTVTISFLYDKDHRLIQGDPALNFMKLSFKNNSNVISIKVNFNICKIVRKLQSIVVIYHIM